MKTGRSIQEMCVELQRQSEAKEDYLVNTSALRMATWGSTPMLHILDSTGMDQVEPLDILNNAHQQIGAYLGIPRKYYERMQDEDPDLLTCNVNRWFSRQQEQRMVRTIDGKARAFLSNRYRRIDNLDIAKVTLPIIAEMPEARYLEGVILYNHATNAYWPEGSEFSDDTPPLCQSADGKTGSGSPGGVCASCRLNKYGSASNGKGKACKNMRTLYLLRSGDVMPLMLSLPPTSIKPFQNFVNSVFTLRRRATYGSLVQIGLKKEESGGFTYSVATFKKLRDFTGEELQRICAYAAAFRDQVKESVAERVEQGMAAVQENVEVAPMPQLPDNEAHFEIGSAFDAMIDGDRMALPA